MRFAYPQMMWLLPVTVVLLTWFLGRAWRKKQQLVAQFVQSRLLAQLTVGVSPSRQKVRLALLVVAVVCALLTLARPQWGFKEEEVSQRGLDIVVAIDTSRSMLAEDVRPNRLARAKFAALDLLKLSKSDRLGLVAFAGDAFLQCPLTLDEEAFRQSLEALDVGIISQGGTLITTAIETALTAFKSDGDNYKILVLFTDGEDHESDALQAAEKAAKAGLRIFTIGVGTPNGELLRVTDEKGVTTYVKDAQGNAVKSRLNEGLLQQIATESSGFYLPLRAAKTIETLYEKGLAPLPKGEISSRLIRGYHERFQWPLALTILLVIGEMLLPERKRVPRSDTIVMAPNAGLRKAVATLLLLAVPLVASGSPASAMRLYEQGKYAEAAKEYERLIEKAGSEASQSGAKRNSQKPDESEPSRASTLAKPDPASLSGCDPRLYFNAGAAAYKAGDLKSAVRHFAVVTTAPDVELQQRAYYNLGGALYRQGEQTQDVKEKLEQWTTAAAVFDAALTLNTQDNDAKFNRDLVRKKVEDLKRKSQQDQNKGGEKLRPSEAAKKAKAEADEAVNRREYRNAFEIMQRQLQVDSTAKAYEDYINRLKGINDAQSSD